MPSANPSAAARRRALVADLEGRGIIRTAAVRRAFLRVPRERFVPEIAAQDGLARIYSDTALLTRTMQSGLPTSSSSQPAIMAEMLEALQLRPGLRVLEIGAGTGYNGALLSTIVGPHGHVSSIELQWDLADKAANALRAGGYPVEVVVGDARHVRVGGGPFDRIILTASTDQVAQLWFDQLVPGGLIVMPLRFGPPGPFHQMVVTFRRDGDGLRSVSVVWGGFMHLRSAGDGGGQPPGEAQVTASEFIDGVRRTWFHVSGEGLRTMTPEARRRLGQLLLADPRRRSFAIGVAGPAQASLLPFVAFAPKTAGVKISVQRSADVGVGIAAPDGRSLAVLVGDKPGRCRLEAFGDTSAADLAMAEVRGWRAAGRPALADMRIDARFGPEPAAGVTVTWPQPGRPGG